MIWDLGFKVVRSRSNVIPIRRGMPTLLVYPETTQISLSYQMRLNISRKLAVQMEFSKHKTMKQMDMDLSMAMQETVDHVKATEVVIMTVLTMIQITICPTLTTVEVSLQVEV
jgi:hypothetical protein